VELDALSRKARLSERRVYARDEKGKILRIGDERRNNVTASVGFEEEKSERTITTRR
jgi:hypothetical protein